MTNVAGGAGEENATRAVSDTWVIRGCRVSRATAGKNAVEL